MKNIAKTIDEAAKLDKQIKELEKKLKPLKQDIESHIRDNFVDKEIVSGVTISGKEGVVKVVGSEKRADADPSATVDFMNKVGKGGKFFEVVKVQVGKLEKVIGKNETDKLRPVVGGVTIRQSFSVNG